MGTAFFFECQQATFHSGNTPPANLGSPLLRSWYLIQPQNQGLGCEGTFPVYLSPNMVASLWGEELGSALGNTAFWSPSSSFYFYSFHFLSHQKSPRAFSSPSLPSLSFPCHFSPDSSSGLVPTSLLLLPSPSSHPGVCFPQSTGRPFHTKCNALLSNTQLILASLAGSCWCFFPVQTLAKGSLVCLLGASIC